MKILTQALIYPMDSENRPVAAMAWDKGRIVRLGDPAELRSAFPGAEIVRADGNVVVPGFIDPHIHFLQGILYRNALDCSPEKIASIEGLRAVLARACDGRPGTHWIVGQGYDPAVLPGRRAPHRRDLDAACPDHPVVIFHYSFHECVANSKALELAGITKDSKDPFAGQIEMDKAGPTGRLIETAMEKVHRLSQDFLLALHRETLLDAFSKAQSGLFSKGITRIGDPAVDASMTDFYTAADEKGKLRIPVVLHFCSNRQMLLLPWDVVTGPRPVQDSPNLIAGPLKIFLDGGDRAGMVLTLGQYALTCLATLVRCLKKASLDPLRTASRSPARLGRDLKVHIGTLMAPVRDSVGLAEKAVENGFPLCFHAIGNEAVRQAVEIIQRVRQAHPAGVPPRIEHALFADDALIGEIKKQGITIVTQPCFLSHMSRDNLPFLPGLKPMPIRSYNDAGIRVAGSSDWPVASCDPLLAMHHAVTRETIGKETLRPDEAVSPGRAMALYTTEAAHALGCSREVGSLEPDKQADFVVLDSDPFLTSRGMKHIRVCQTWLRGERVYAADE